MKLSVIICTLDRSTDLLSTLDSIFAGSLLPEEIIIIDQSDNQKTKECIESLGKSIVHYHHLSIKSLTKSRNFWVEKLNKNSDMAIFLDDDVTVDTNCIQNISKYMQDHKHYLWGTLNIATPSRHNGILKKLWFFLLTAGLKFEKQFVTKGWFNAMFLEQPDKSVHIDRCSGCAMFFRKKVLDEWFRFPKYFQKYSLMEDVFFSYAVHKKYPNSLHYIPDAKVIHHESPIRSIPPRAKILQNIIHRFLFVQEFDLSYIWYIWTTILLWVLDLITYKKISVLSRYIEWVLYVVKNRNVLSLDGNLLDYNIFIFQK